MKDINEVIRSKQAQKAVLDQQIAILTEAIRLMQEEEKMAEPTPLARAAELVSTPASGQGTGTGPSRWP